MTELADMFNKANHSSIVQGLQTYDNLFEAYRSFREWSDELISEVELFIKNKSSEENKTDKLAKQGGIPVDPGQD
jgi:hypothetical protein